MKLLNLKLLEADIEFTLDEIILLKKALNEVFNGIKIIDFDREIGISREEYEVIFKFITNLIYDQKKIFR